MRTSNQRAIAPQNKKQDMTTVGILKRMLSGEELKSRFNDILGEKAPQFMASIVNATAGNKALQECDPNSILSAALVAATLDLPIDQNLGFAALVPYSGKAQFQVMWKGFVQLAQRSGQYATMGRGVVYEDEIVSYNPIYGDIVLVDDFSACKQRMNGEDDKIAGYLAWFEMNNGFRKELYMTKAEVEHHALTYSKSYQYDKAKGKKASRWSIDFNVMAQKTVIKRLLSQWGILSIEMQRAMQEDQKVYDASGAGSYEDNPTNEDDTGDEPVAVVTEAEFTEAPADATEATDATPDDEMENLFGEEEAQE